jgi:hypothetical protein
MAEVKISEVDAKSTLDSLGLSRAIQDPLL